MKTYYWVTQNRFLSHLRLATAPLLTCLAALFISVTTPAVASGPSANPDAPRSTFVTSTPKAPPQVPYMLIELGGRTAFDISRSGQIVGNKEFAPGLRRAAFWPSSRSAAIDLGTLTGLNSVARSINSRREIVGVRLTKTSLLSGPCFGQVLTVPRSNSPVCRPALRVKCTTSIHQAKSSARSLTRTFQ